MGKTVSTAKGLSPPKLWKRKWPFSEELFDNRAHDNHFNTSWCLTVFQTHRGKVHQLPPRQQEPLDLLKVKGIENDSAGQGASYRGSEGRLQALKGSPAGNPALNPCSISLDCKIYASSCLT